MYLRQVVAIYRCVMLHVVAVYEWKVNYVEVQLITFVIASGGHAIGNI
jgi:hypothetical protein